MILTEAEIMILLDLLSKKVLANPELKENLEKKLDQLMDIPPLYDDWIEKEKSK